MADNRVCPMLLQSTDFKTSYDCECREDFCAWWCDWAESCALVAIAAGIGEIGDGRHNIGQTLR